MKSTIICYLLQFLVTMPIYQCYKTKKCLNLLTHIFTYFVSFSITKSVIVLSTFQVKKYWKLHFERLSMLSECYNHNEKMQLLTLLWSCIIVAVAYITVFTKREDKVWHASRKMRLYIMPYSHFIFLCCVDVIGDSWLNLINRNKFCWSVTIKMLSKN